MIRFTCAALAIVLTAAGAQAADLPEPRRQMPVFEPAIFEPTPVLRWTGFYAGGHLGGAWGNQGGGSNEKNLFCVVQGGTSFPCDLPSYTNANQRISGKGNSASLIGGAQAGYNHQITEDFFIGAVVDFTLMNRTRDKRHVLQIGDPVIQSTSFEQSNSSNWLSTARLRLGVVSDELALYFTGGLAVADISSSTRNVVKTTAFDLGSNTREDTVLTGGGSSSGVGLGWTLGGGIEYRFAEHWSVGLEYLYYRVNNSYNVNVAQQDPAPAASVSYRVKAPLSGNIVRAGVNYHF